MTRSRLISCWLLGGTLLFLVGGCTHRECSTRREAWEPALRHAGYATLPAEVPGRGAAGHAGQPVNHPVDGFCTADAQPRSRPSPPGDLPPAGQPAAPQESTQPGPGDSSRFDRHASPLRLRQAMARLEAARRAMRLAARAGGTSPPPPEPVQVSTAEARLATQPTANSSANESWKAPPAAGAARPKRLPRIDSAETPNAFR
ncbi:hypothetical protein [Roseimaritima sediminicola]|uniref:hypothetical protein n=1 Tax=Roseimaritima sediminicola TaxID=2662066 RepID=UPI0012984CD1|nr:hypothetical protein [Roseimaritima sediminicola]